MTIARIAGLAVVAVLCLMGLIVFVAGVLHLYQDHLWDDQIRLIQKQQIQQQQQQAPPAK